MSARLASRPGETPSPRMRRGWLRAAAVAALACATSGLAQSGGAFEIVRRTADAGGGSSTGAGFAVTGSLGQPDAGRLQGGAFDLQGGFHRRASGATAPDALFADGFE